MQNNLIELQKHIVNLVKNGSLNDAKSKLEQFFGNVEAHSRKGNKKEKDFIDNEIKNLKILYGKVLYGLKMFGTGIKFLQTIEHIADNIIRNKDTKEYLIAINIYLDIAYGFLELKAYDKSFIYSKKAFDICKNEFYPEQLLSAMDLMVIKLLKEKKYKEVNSYYKQMEIIYNNINIGEHKETVKLFQYMLEGKKADLLIQQKQYDKALDLLRNVSNDFADNDLSEHPVYSTAVKAILESFIFLAKYIGCTTPESIQEFINKNGIGFKFA